MPQLHAAGIFSPAHADVSKNSAGLDFMDAHDIIVQDTMLVGFHGHGFPSWEST